jgi:hypothetical protein
MPYNYLYEQILLLPAFCTSPVARREPATCEIERKKKECDAYGFHAAAAKNILKIGDASIKTYFIIPKAISNTIIINGIMIIKPMRSIS